MKTGFLKWSLLLIGYCMSADILYQASFHNHVSQCFEDSEPALVRVSLRENCKNDPLGWSQYNHG